ncbi:MAG: CHAT domain-containing protein [Cyclobacteriaceae bacterium]|jgi:CHAT domain-containing protein
MKNSTHFFLTIFFVFLFSFSISKTYGQTWEVVLAKAEKHYVKGKFHKIAKITAKLKDKHIQKKFNNDTTLFVWLTLMEAKAFEAQKNYPQMNMRIDSAAKELIAIKDVNPTVYYVGQMRLVDLYNEYGNYKKADSLITILSAEYYYSTSSLIANEITIRKAITLVNNGDYLAAEPILDEMVTLFPTIKNGSYDGEIVNKLDLAYRTNLQHLIKINKMRLMTERGLYQAAEQKLDEYAKSFNRELVKTQEAYFKSLALKIDLAYQRGDIKDADKYMGQYLGAKPVGNRLEEGLMRKVEIDMANDNNSGVFKTRDLFRKYAKSVKAPEKYGLFHNVYIDAFDDFMDKEYDQVFKNINDAHFVSSGIVPLDHPSREKLYSAGIRFSEKAVEIRYQHSADSYYPLLKTTIDKRYVQGLYQGIYDIRRAGYFLSYTETPIEAFKLLDDRPYINVFNQLTKSQTNYADLVNRLNEYLIIKGEYEEGIKLNKNVVEGMRSNPEVDGVDLGTQMVSLALMQTMGGYYRDAEINVDDALKIIRKDGEKISGEYIKALNSSATLYATIGRYDKAEDLLYKSKAIGKKLGSESDAILLNSIEDLAVINTRLGNYSETEELLNKVIFDKTDMYGGFSRRLIKPYNALGQMFLIRGEFTEAEKNIRKSLAITKKVYGDSTLYYADNQSNLVKLYLELGNYKPGLENATEIYNLRKSKLRPDHILLAESLTDIGLIRYHLGDSIVNIEQYFVQAKNIVEANFDKKHPLYAEALKNLAYIYVKKNELDSALLLLDQADEIWSDLLGNRNISSGEVSRLKGDIYSYKQRFSMAKHEYERASKFFRKIFSEEHPEYLKTQSKLAQSYFIDGEVQKVQKILETTTSAYLNYTKVYFPTLSEEEKSRFWAKIKPDFEFYNTIAVLYKDQKEKYISDMYDFALVTKGLLLNSSIKTRNAILNSGDSTIIKEFESWMAKKEYLTNTLAQSAENLESNQVDVKALKDEIATLEKSLSEKSETFSNTYESDFYTWKDVKDVLGDHEAAVEIVRYRTFDTDFNEEKVTYAALVVTQDTKRNPKLIVLENGNDLEKRHFNRLRNSINFKVRDENGYNVYWKQIQEAIGDKTVIYLSPDGIYNQINIESLATEGGGYMIDKVNVRVVNSTKTLPEYRSKGAKKERKRLDNEPMVAMLFGNPKYYESESSFDDAINENPTRALTTSRVPQLPGTEVEVGLVSGLLNDMGWEVNTYIGEDATEDAIKSIKNVTLLHIATHGFFDDKPRSKNKQFGLFDDDNPLERSGILTQGGGEVLLEASDNYNIADGVLTAYEAMNLNFDKTELVVLSACETGRGEIEQGEGVFGLQRSFLVAGADALIMSLFQVSDEVTQKLMVEFYKYWLGGRSKREAFNAAQLSIRNEYPDPIYWGAFLMVAKE